MSEPGWKVAAAKRALGICERWKDRADANEVRSYHKPLFQRWKRRQGFKMGGTMRLDEATDLIPSVQALYDYGYSQSDIAVMFGVTRECVRQWFERYDLERYDGSESGSGSLARLWDDEAMCFLPVSDDELVTKVRKAKKRARRERLHRKRAAHVAVLKQLAEQLGRVPTLKETVKAIGYGSWTGFARTYWGVKTHGSYSRAADRLYRAAGFTERPRQFGRGTREIGGAQ